MSLRGKFFSISAFAVALATFSTFAAAQESNPNKDQNPTQKERKFEGRKGFGKKDNFRKRKGDGFGRGFGGMHGGLRGFRGIELTDAQKEQIRTILEANRPDQATIEELRTLRQAHREGTVTPEQQERMQYLRDQARQRGQLVRQQIQAVLTPEQRQQIEQKKAEMRERMQQRRQLRRQNPQTPQDN